MGGSRRPADLPSAGLNAEAGSPAGRAGCGDSFSVSTRSAHRLARHTTPPAAASSLGLRLPRLPVASAHPRSTRPWPAASWMPTPRSQASPGSACPTATTCLGAFGTSMFGGSAPADPPSRIWAAYCRNVICGLGSWRATRNERYAEPKCTTVPRASSHAHGLGRPELYRMAMRHSSQLPIATRTQAPVAGTLPRACWCVSSSQSLA
jgi:hypothetical protein